MTPATATSLRLATCGTLLTMSGLHVAWSRGSPFPFRSQAALTDQVVGAPRTPSRNACCAVAATLAGAAAVVELPSRGPLHRLVLSTMAAVFALACFGFAGRTDLLVPGSSSPTFRRNDRRLFAPICGGLAIGCAVTARRRT